MSSSLLQVAIVRLPNVCKTSFQQDLFNEFQQDFLDKTSLNKILKLSQQQDRGTRQTSRLLFAGKNPSDMTLHFRLKPFKYVIPDSCIISLVTI